MLVYNGGHKQLDSYVGFVRVRREVKQERVCGLSSIWALEGCLRYSERIRTRGSDNPYDVLVAFSRNRQGRGTS